MSPQETFALLRVCGFLYVLGHAIYSFSQVRDTENIAFKMFGRLLRFPVFLIAIYLWARFIFPILVAVAVLAPLLQIAAYPIIRAAAFVLGAFFGEEKPPTFENYWQDFPDRYLRWLRFGTVGLEGWTIKGAVSD